MKFFCTDLDKTLIFSYRHEIGPDKVLVETMGEKELSYMSVPAFELLEQIAAEKRVVPVTTRSLAQYRRINFGTSVPIHFALVANGGILLRGGIIDEKWFKESRELACDADEELQKGSELLEQDLERCFEVRRVDELFIFTKSENPVRTVEQLKNNLDEEKVYIDSNGQKVYIFPKVLSKGAAIARFRSAIAGDGGIIAAGDSEFDIPMLLQADFGLCPESLGITGDDSILAFPDKVFAVEMLREVLKH